MGGAQAIPIFIDEPEETAFDEKSVWGTADATGALMGSIGKFAKKLQLVENRDDACYVIKSKARIRNKRQSTASELFVGRRAHAFVAARAVDSAGKIVFSDEAKDTSRLMGWTVGDWNKQGMAKATDRLAKRMNKALKRLGCSSDQ